MSEVIKKTFDINSLRILSSVTTITAAALSDVLLGATIDHSAGYPILFKLYFQIDGQPELYHSPTLNSALGNLAVYTYAYVGTNSIYIIVNNGDTIAHTFKVYF